MFLISNELTQRGKYHYTEKMQMDKWQKKTLRSNVARMNVSATHNRDRDCGRAPSPNCWQFSNVLLLKTSESPAVHSHLLETHNFPCGAHLVLENETRLSFVHHTEWWICMCPFHALYERHNTKNIWLRDSCDLTDALCSLRTTWNRLWASIHLLHQHRESTFSTCTLHFLIGTHWSICSNLAPTTLPNLLLTFSLLCTWTCWKPNTSCLATSSNTLHGSWWEPNLPTYNITASIWAEHNPNSTYPWCSSHTQSLLIKSFFPALVMQEIHKKTCPHHRVRQTWCSYICWCFFAPATNLNVMIEILLKKFSFSKHLKQTALVWPPSNHGPPRREIV